MRDCNRYLQMLNGFESYLYSKRYTIPNRIGLATIFIPIVFAIRVNNTEKSNLFEKGMLAEELLHIIKTQEAIKNAFQNFIFYSYRIPREDITEEDIHGLYLDIFATYTLNNASRRVTDSDRDFLKRMLSIVKL